MPVAEPWEGGKTSIEKNFTKEKGCQVGWGLEQSALVEGVLAHGKEWNEMNFKSLPTQILL